MGRRAAQLRGKESFLPRRVALCELQQTGGVGEPGGIFQDAPSGPVECCGGADRVSTGQGALERIGASLEKRANAK